MDTLNILNKPPRVKDFDRRCSTNCVINWKKYKQPIPIGKYCKCTQKDFFRRLINK